LPRDTLLQSVLKNQRPLVNVLYVSMGKRIAGGIGFGADNAQGWNAFLKRCRQVIKYLDMS